MKTPYEDFAFDETPRITINEGPGKQITNIIEALRNLADALETLTEPIEEK